MLNNPLTQYIEPPPGRQYTFCEAQELSALLNDYIKNLKKGTNPEIVAGDVNDLSKLFLEVLDMRLKFPKELEAFGRAQDMQRSMGNILSGAME